MNKMTKKQILKTDTISFDEFIDLITDGRGEQIKKDLKKLEEETQ